MKSMTPASEQYFARVAGDWDRIRSGYYGDEVREAAIHKSHLHPSMVVADVGAGSGYISKGLAPLVRELHVVDGSGAMLETAQRNLVAYGNVVYHLADGLSLPFEDESLEAVFANMYLHHCPNPLASIQEMVRMLKPGGRLTLTDMDSHPYAWLKSEMADVWQGFDRAELRGWLAEAGLVNVLIDCSGESCRSMSSNSATTAEQSQVEISIFVATGTKRVRARDLVQAGYAARAESGGGCCSPSPEGAQSSCCTPQAVISTDDLLVGAPILPGYDATEVASVPAEAAGISLGCGNPTALAGLQPGESVLDIGSGGGIDVFLAARKVGAEGRVIGVDMTPAMLERARRSAEKAGLANVEFRQGYAEALPAEDGTVDVIISNCVINLTEDKALAWREAYRVLKPGGRVEVSDVATDLSLPVHLRLDARGWAECVTGALPLKETIDLMKQAGFREITTRPSAQNGKIEGVAVFSTQFSARK
jgi:ubiquinone/menaquinone biosynthesis C-methylase UbiE